MYLLYSTLYWVPVVLQENEGNDDFVSESGLHRAHVGILGASDGLPGCSGITVYYSIRGTAGV